MKPSLPTRAAAEFLGTAFLVAAVIGSGIMGERLSGGNAAIALLTNTIATGAALVALISTFGSISGAHFNPVVSISDAMERKLRRTDVFVYVLAQCSGGIFGATLANAMFSLPLVTLSRHARSGPAQLLSEFVATFGLLSVIWGCSRSRSNMTAFAVAAYITAAYWFTASTSFANPAVTLARSLSDSFAGIKPASVFPFVVVQFAGGTAATFLFRWLSPNLQFSATDVR